MRKRDIPNRCRLPCLDGPKVCRSPALGVLPASIPRGDGHANVYSGNCGKAGGRAVFFLGDDWYSGAKLRATNLRDPLHRHLYRLIAPIVARKRGAEWICQQDMCLLYCLLTGTPFNMAHCMAGYFFEYHRKSINGSIVCGHVITKIAKNLGLEALLEDLLAPPVSPHPQGMDSIPGMRITKIINGKRTLIGNDGNTRKGPEVRAQDEVLPPLVVSFVSSGWWRTWAERQMV